MFKIKFFLTVYLEKIAVLVLCSSSRHLSFLRFICSALLLLPAALLSSAHLHLSSHPFSCRLLLYFSLLRSAFLLCSQLSSRLPLFISSVRFVLWLQRLNLLTKHTKLHMCTCTQGKTHTHFSPSPRPKCNLGYIQLVRIKTRAVSNLSTCMCAANLDLSCFSAVPPEI